MSYHWQKYGHLKNDLLITGCTRVYHNDNVACTQSRECSQNDYTFVSVVWIRTHQINFSMVYFSCSLCDLFKDTHGTMNRQFHAWYLSSIFGSWCSSIAVLYICYITFMSPDVTNCFVTMSDVPVRSFLKNTLVIKIALQWSNLPARWSNFRDGTFSDSVWLWIYAMFSSLPQYGNYLLCNI